jgi:inner membrane protein
MVKIKYLKFFCLFTLKCKVLFTIIYNININNMNSTSNSLSGLGQRLGTSISFKLFVVLVLMILFLIPVIPVMVLLEDRQQRQNDVLNEINQQWGGAQQISSPIIVIPYMSSPHTAGLHDPIDPKAHFIYILPNEFEVVSELSTSSRQRGRFEVAVYEGNLQIKGQFPVLDETKLNLDPSRLDWAHARLVLGTGPFKGLKEAPAGTFGSQSVLFESALDGAIPFAHTLSAPIVLTQSMETAQSFELSLPVRGSDQITLMPLAGQTKWKASGDWSAPKFIGTYLPDTSNVQNQQFEAEWQVTHLSRSVPGQWVSGPVRFIDREVQHASTASDGAETIVSRELAAESFGISFIQPNHPYQQTERTVKYGILFSMLTFVSLLITEWTQKRGIHVVQYVWVGCSMIVFYILLLSLSEQVGFGWAYLLAASATIGLVATFVGTILKSRTWGLAFGGILTLFYSFLGILVQLEETALLVGSIGMFVTLGIIMYFSSKIPWDGEMDVLRKEN